MPPWASGPVFTVSRPSLNGAACAWTAGAFSVAMLAPVASMPLRTDRRLIDIALVSLVVIVLRPLFAGDLDVRTHGITAAVRHRLIMIARLSQAVRYPDSCV